MRGQRAFLSFVAMGTIITKMVTPLQKAFCVLKFESCKSVITVHRAFCGQFNWDPPNANNIRRWHNQLATTGCLCKGKNVGRPRVSEEKVQRVWDAFVRSPKKSVRKASRELAMPVMTVWKVLRKRLHMRPYRLQLLQAYLPWPPRSPDMTPLDFFLWRFVKEFARVERQDSITCCCCHSRLAD
ncbi:hypothetical protein C0J52_18522 [Blattella germanica]|nr:hypothetical protein C0J52_18522 [Blattella germanica]PSN48397.1 hypothetical protein C0J52_18522 [Blattella germanica]